MIKVLIYFVLFNKCFTYKIFDFDKTKSENVLSSAALSNKPKTTLPKNFILCSSHFQREINTQNVHGIYVIYRDEKLLNPWLSIGIWTDNILWANIAFKHWYPLGSVPDELMDKWIHICIRIDIVEKSIEANINGQTYKPVLDVEGLTPTPFFNLLLGLVHESYQKTHIQFHGQITNIHLIHLNGKHNLTLLSKSTCKMERTSNNLIWDDMIWTHTNVNETFLDQRKICKSEFTLLRIPLKWSYEESKDECSKFGNGQIAGVDNPKELKDLISLKQIYGDEDDCTQFWTSYIYNDLSSSKVESIYTNEKHDISWDEDFPYKSKIKENSEVLFLPKLSKFQNIISNPKACLLCNSSRKNIISYTLHPIFKSE